MRRLARRMVPLVEETPLCPLETARGVVLSVLRWVVHHAPGGRLDRYDPSLIAAGVGWEDEPGELVAMLQEAGFLDDERRFVRLAEMRRGCGPYLGPGIG